MRATAKANDGVIDAIWAWIMLNHCLQWDKFVLRTHPLQRWFNLYKITSKLVPSPLRPVFDTLFSDASSQDHNTLFDLTLVSGEMDDSCTGFISHRPSLSPQCLQCP